MEDAEKDNGVGAAMTSTGRARGTEAYMGRPTATSPGPAREQRISGIGTKL